MFLTEDVHALDLESRISVEDGRADLTGKGKTHNNQRCKHWASQYNVDRHMMAQAVNFAISNKQFHVGKRAEAWIPRLLHWVGGTLMYVEPETVKLMSRINCFLY